MKLLCSRQQARSHTRNSDSFGLQASVGYLVDSANFDGFGSRQLAPITEKMSLDGILRHFGYRRFAPIKLSRVYLLV